MNEFPSPKQFLRATLGFVLLVAGLALNAQTQSSLIAPRITEPVNETSLVTLTGTVSPLANAQNDAGQAPADTQVNRLQLILKRSPQQESDLQELIANMHTPGSASYHKWLTPTQFGQQFGPADQDVQAIQAWVQSHGFAVGALHPSKGILEISGTIGQIQDTFHTSIHKYSVGGQLHYANATNPQIPSALSPVLGGFVSLNNFPVHRMSRTLGKATYDPQTGHATPQWTNPDSNSPLGYDLVVSPADFDVQYDLSPLYSAGTNGTGQTVAIINDSNININFVNNFRSLFGLPANPPQVIIDGNDPGIDGINNPDGPNYDSIEAYLDVEWSGAVAPNATIDLVIGADTALESGLILAAEHAISSNLAPVMSVSFGACEQSLGSNNQFLNSLWEQAAAQGITVLVASGDSGSAGTDPQGLVCDNFSNPSDTAAHFGLAVSGYASTPYNVAVGGTDFYYSQYQSATLPTQLGTYWNLTPSSTPKASLTTPIPEQPWNDTAFGLNIFTSSIPSIGGGSGGASSCATGTANPQTGEYVLCSGGYPKPAWQTGTGVPSDKVRDIPDVSLFAADGLNDSFYPICAQDGDCQSGASTPQITGVGGTSASSPAMGGIMALVNQKYGAQGQADFVLYPLAKQHPTAFHDVTSGTNAVPCITGSPNCVAGGSVQGEGELSGYAAGPGYDLATGLGSIDANQLVSNWNSVSFTSTTVTLTPSSTTFTHGTAVNFTTNVTGQGGTPTGNVTLMTDSSGVNQQSQFIVFPLTNGSGSGSVSTLPGGTYHVWGQYGGDGTFGASTSSKTQITVNPESSSLIFNVVSPTGSGFQAIGSGSNAVNQVPYGTQIVLDGEVVPTTYYNQCNGGNSTSTTCKNYVLAPATGTVTFKDGSNTINTAAINAEGDAEFTTGGFALGTHSVTASYPGDASYNSSSASAVSFTVVKGSVTVTVAPSLSPIAQGQTLVLSALVDGASTGGAAPTGTVQFANGTTLLGKATLSSTTDASTGAVAGIGALTLSNLSLPTGSETITATYSGDTNYNTGAGSANLLVNGASGLLASSVSGNASASATSPTAGITVSATVTGQNGHPAPTGTIDFQSSGQDLGKIAITQGKSGDTSTVSLTVNSGILLQGTNAITLQYSGDTTYQASSTTLSINNPLSDFSMVAVSPALSVASGSSTTDTLNFTSVNGFNSSVALTCTAPSAITCSLSPTSLTVNGTTSATLTVKAASATSELRPESRPAWFWASGGATLACVFLLGLPKHRRKWQSLLGLLVIAVLTAAIGCGGGSSSSSSGSTSSSGGSSSGSSTSGNTSAGTYTVLVSAAQGSTVTHNLSITVRVQ